MNTSNFNQTPALQAQEGAVLIQIGGSEVYIPQLTVLNISSSCKLIGVESLPPQILGFIPYDKRHVPVIDLRHLINTKNNARYCNLVVIGTFSRKESMKLIGLAANDVRTLDTASCVKTQSIIQSHVLLRQLEERCIAHFNLDHKLQQSVPFF